MADHPKFVPSQPKANVFRRLRTSIFVMVPFVVWFGGVAGVLYLAQQQARPLDYPGMASIQGDGARQHGAGGSVGIGDRQIDLDGRAVRQCRRGEFQEFKKQFDA